MNNNTSNTKRSKDFCKYVVRFYHEKEIIQNNEMQKSEARALYKCVQNYVPVRVFPFIRFLSMLGRFKVVKRPENLGVVVFNEVMLTAIISDEDFNFNAPKNVVIVNQNLAFSPKKKSQPDTKCKVCLVDFKTEQGRASHESSKTHIMGDIVINRNWKKYQNKSIIIECKFDHGSGAETVMCPLASTKVSVNLINRSKTDVELIKVVALNKKLERFVVLSNYAGVVRPGCSVPIDLSVTFNEKRSYDYPLVFFLKLNNVDVQLVKHLTFEHLDDMYRDLLPTAPYIKKKPVIKDIGEIVIPGERLAPSSFKPIIPLQKYPLTKDFIAVVNAGLENTLKTTWQEELRLAIKKQLDVSDKKNCLNTANYTKMLDLLLFFEEHQMQVDIRNYDTKAILKPRGFSYELRVPGLSEHRPSLVVGDAVYVKCGIHKYEGIVHTKELDSVILRFNKAFAESVFIPNKEFDISFGYNRTTIKMEHQAVHLIKEHRVAECFFPTKAPDATALTDIKFVWANREKIGNNKEQQSAVKHILANTSYPMPYLIFGPPGTGKTSTVVETIQQIYKLQPSKRILVCTPSNSAANEVNRRLTNIPTTDLLRYMSFSYPYKEIFEEVRRYCNYSQRVYYNPSIEQVTSARIIITTLTMAGKLYNMGVPKNHFAYVIIDESGHATESETLIPLAGILTDLKTISGQIVLAGDPKQLGPIIHSPIAVEYGFDRSMLERLMNTMDVYKKHNGKYNGNLVTKLLTNYRSHPELLKIPNKQFYENELIPHGSAFSNIAIGHEILINKNYPMIFHSVFGKDEREATSPSFFNMQEIKVVIDYINRLLGVRMSGTIITEEHIGIITPYRRQVQKIKQLCVKQKWEKMMVGSVEQLQGQEREIIIISTVRSKPEYVQHDLKFRLGFLKNPKRFNVAITRAKALLIVIGNPELLQCDELWRSYIKACVDNNSIAGSSFTLQSDEELLLNGISNLNIGADESIHNEGQDFSRNANI